MTLTDAIRDVERAARTLAPEQGRIARRNARRRILSALARVRRALDTEAPAIRAAPSKRRANRTIHERMRDLERDGWQELGPNDATVLARCAVAGIKPRVFDVPVSKGVTRPRSFLPAWAVQIAQKIVDPSKLLEARRSATVRAGLLALLTLKDAP